ncbi:MAG: electron transfer flavoprotein subunit alpha/FixB family protein [Acidobacteriota bacterium]
MSNEIWVLLQHRDGALHRGSREAIAAARAIAGRNGGEVVAVLIGKGIADLATTAATYDVARVCTVEHDALADYTPGGYVGVLSAAILAAAPAFVVAPHTYQSVEYVPRLAQAVDAALVPEVVAFEDRDGLAYRRPIMGGKLQAVVRTRGEGTVVLTVQSGAFSADDAGSGSAEVVALADAGEPAVDREIVGVEQAAEDTVDLSSADVIVAAGRGVGGEDKMGPITALAAALGADIGASRPVIDSGWLPRDRQIGSSGQTVAPKLYIAAGISGAIQHLVGMKGATCVVAINKDRNAPIFSVARYGVIGDLHEVLPALTTAIEEAKAAG